MISHKSEASAQTKKQKVGRISAASGYFLHCSEEKQHNNEDSDRLSGSGSGSGFENTEDGHKSTDY